MLRIDFEEEMSTSGINSITDIGNYIVDGEILDDLDSEVTFVVINNRESLEIYIPSLYDDSEDGVDLSATGNITMGRVADASGNYTLEYSYVLAYEAEGIVGFESVYAIDVDTIEVTLDSELNVFEVNDFIIYLDTIEATIIAVENELNEDDNTVIVFTIAEELNYDGTIASVRTVSDPESLNAYGESLVADADIVVVDAIEPDLETIIDDDKNVYVEYATSNEVYLVFEEAIDSNSISTMSFEVGGGEYEVTAVNDNDEIIILIVSNANPDDLIGVEVIQTAPVKDLAGNAVTGLTAVIYLNTPAP